MISQATYLQRRETLLREIASLQRELETELIIANQTGADMIYYASYIELYNNIGQTASAVGSTFSGLNNSWGGLVGAGINLAGNLFSSIKASKDLERYRNASSLAGVASQDLKDISSKLKAKQQELVRLDQQYQAQAGASQSGSLGVPPLAWVALAGIALFASRR